MKTTLDHIKKNLVEEGVDGGIWRFGNLKVVASWGLGWDHVSVSCQTRLPRWDEMQSIKDLFFEPEECAMQLHPPKSTYKNFHPFCLHIWRPQNQAIPMPPQVFV